MEEAGADPVRWRIASADRVRVVRLDDAALVFNPLSWQTHYLNEAAHCVFDALSERPMSVNELVVETVEAADRVSAADNARWTRALRAHLRDLAAMGLITQDAEDAGTSL